MRNAVMRSPCNEARSVSGAWNRVVNAKKGEKQMTDATRVALYANSGTTLFHYSVDVAAAALVRRGSITLPIGVQYAAPHPRRSFLYVACSNGSPGVLGDTHCVAALRIDPANGQLHLHGDAVALPARPI